MSSSDTSAGKADPSAIIRLATGYWPSAALLAAVDLGLFSALADRTMTADEIAAALRADRCNTAYFLNALSGLGLVEKSDSTYSLPIDYRAFLIPGRPGYLGSAILWARDQYAAWGNLAETVRTGCPAVEPELHLGSD